MPGALIYRRSNRGKYLKPYQRAAARIGALALFWTWSPCAPAQPKPAQVLQSYSAVTAERLRNPEDRNWLMIRRTYDGWGYSPLSQITPANVGRLRPVWVFPTGESYAHEAAPVINNGIMFVSTPNSQVLAIDARTGNLLWRYRRPRPVGTVVYHETNRGVALYGDKVYYASADAILVALDARTGREVWATAVADNKAGYYMTLAPLVAGGAVMVGTSGGELGIRGFVAAYNPETGKQLWRTYTIPAPGEPGSETWPKGDQWKTGGGPVWITGNYDPVSNLAFWGTGNAGPWLAEQRPGDNLYTASTIAVDAATGRIRGHFQYNPNDSWDWDEVSPPLLIDFQRSGRAVRGLVDAARDGYLWFLDRSDGPIHFVEGKPYVNQNVFKGLDPQTGRPDVDPARRPGINRQAENCPSHWGGKNFPPIAFSPLTRMIYIPVNENLCETTIGRDVAYTPGRGFTGVRFSLFAVPNADHIGEVQAWNVDTGVRVWTHTYPKSPNWGGMLVTAGGLVFTGGTNDRLIHAFEASTGKLLWEYPTNSGILAPPVSFEIDGRQYIAVNSGWGVDARAMEASLNRLFPGEYPEVPEGGSILVFALQPGL